MPRRNGIDVEDYPADQGCSTATKHLRNKYNTFLVQSKCVECPFKKCIDDLTHEQKMELDRYAKGEVTILSRGIKSMAVVASSVMLPRSNVRA